MKGRAIRAGGFTLVELLSGLVLAGVVAAAVVGVLLSQHEFYGASAARTHARQATRAAAEVISSELRMASPHDLLAAGPDSVSVRADVLRGVVCGPGGSTAGGVAVYAFDTVTNPNLPAGFRGYAYSDPGTGAWRRVDRAPLDVSPGSGRSSCVARAAPPGGPDWRYRTVTGWRAAGSFDTVPARGAVLTKYGRLTFSIEPSGSHPGALAIYRNSQELVSPVADGAAFGYLLADGSELPGVAPAALRDVRAVRLGATAVSPRPRYRAESPLRLHVALQP